MISSPRIAVLLTEIANLLTAHNESDWAQCFDRLLAEYSADPHGACSQIRSIYGWRPTASSPACHPRLPEGHEELAHSTS